MLTAVLDRLGNRLRQRKQSAREIVETAARKLAQGESVDEAAVEGALVEAGLGVDALGKLAELYVGRLERKKLLAALPAATKRKDVAEAKLAAEDTKHREIVEAFHRRVAGIREEVAGATKDVEAGRAARGWLLEPEHCPPSLRDELVAAMEREHAARVALERAEQSGRATESDIKSEESYIRGLEAEEERTITPGGPLVAKSQRDRLSAATRHRIDEHERRIRRLRTRLAEIADATKQARDELNSATIALASIQERVLGA